MASREEELDERIIALQLENRDFEKNAEQTIKTLDKLQNAMDLEDAGEGISGAASSMLAFEEATDSVQKKFSLLDFAKFAAVEKIVGAIIDRVSGFLKSVTLDPLTTGWAKYEEETASVQTIMAATKLSIEEVEEELSKLSTFSDETSYSYADMTNNVGKFTSQNIPLDESVRAMEGIALWAAKSGQNSATAARAMYNMSQALGVGSVKLMDWRSIENANMATTEFKQLALDTAVALGTLIEKDGKYYATVKADADDASNAVQQSVKKVFDVTKNGYVEVVQTAGKAASKVGGLTEVSIENFSSTLSEGWFDKDVLMSTLDVYGQGVATIEKYMNDHGLRYMGEAVQAMKEEGYDFVNDIGLSSFIAAQEAKTWRDAVDSAKDAASTKWKDVWKTFFGNYDTAKVFFTDVANAFYDWFIEPLNRLNEILGKFNEFGGGEAFRDIAYNIMDAVYAITDAIYTGLGEVWTFFNDDITVGNAWNLLNFVYRIRDGLQSIGIFTKDENGALVLTNEAAFAISETAYNIAYVLDKTFSLIKRLASGFNKITKPIIGFAGRIFAYTTDLITMVLDLNEELGITETIGSVLSEIFNGIASVFALIFGSNELEEADETIESLGSHFQKVELSADKISGILTGIRDIFSAIWDNVKKIGGSLKNLGSALFGGISVNEIGSDVKDVFISIIDTVGNATVKIIDFITYLVKLATGAEDLDKAKTSLKDFFTPFIEFFTEFDKNHPVIYDAILTIWGWVKSLIGYLWDFIQWAGSIVKGWVENASLSDLISAIIAAMVIKIALAIKTMSEVVGDVLETFSATARANMFKSLALVFLGIAAAILAFAWAIKIIHDLPDPGWAISIVVSIFAGLVIAVGLIARLVKSMSEIKPEKKTFTDIIAGIFGQNKTPIDSMSKLIISIAASMFIIVLAIKTLAKAMANDTYGDKITSAFGLLFWTLIVMMAGVIAILHMSQDLEKGSLNGLWLIMLVLVLGMVSMVKKMAQLANSIKDFSTAKVWALGGAIGVVFAAIGLAIWLASKNKPDDNVAKTIKSFATIVFAISLCLGAIGWMMGKGMISWKDMAIAAGTIFGLFTLVSLVSKFLLKDINVKGIYAITVAMIGIAGAIALVAFSINKFLGDINPKQLWNAAGAVLVLLGVLALIPLIFVALKASPVSFVIMAAGIVLLAGAIGIVSYALYELSEKGKDVWRAMGVILILMGVMAALVIVMGILAESGIALLGVLVIGLIVVAILVLAEALKTVQQSFTLLQSVDLAFIIELAKASTELGVGFIFLGAGALIMGVGTLLASAGLMQLSYALEMFKSVVGEGNFDRIVNRFIDITEKMDPFVDSIFRLADALVPLTSRLWDLFLELLEPVFDVLQSIFGVIGDMFRLVGVRIESGWDKAKNFFTGLFGGKKDADDAKSTFESYADDIDRATASTRSFGEEYERVQDTIHARDKKIGTGSATASIGSKVDVGGPVGEPVTKPFIPTYDENSAESRGFIDNIQSVVQNVMAGVDMSGLTNQITSAVSQAFSGNGSGLMETIMGGQNGTGDSFLSNFQNMLGGDGSGLMSAFTSAIGPDTEIGQMMSGDAFGENFMTSGLGAYFSGEAFAQNPAFSNPVEISQTIFVKHEFPVLQVKGTADDGTITEISNEVLANLHDEVITIITDELTKEARLS